MNLNAIKARRGIHLAPAQGNSRLAVPMMVPEGLRGRG